MAKFTANINSNINSPRISISECKQNNNPYSNSYFTSQEVNFTLVCWHPLSLCVKQKRRYLVVCNYCCVDSFYKNADNFLHRFLKVIFVLLFRLKKSFWAIVYWIFLNYCFLLLLSSSELKWKIRKMKPTLVADEMFPEGAGPFMDLDEVCNWWWRLSCSMICSALCFHPTEFRKKKLQPTLKFFLNNTSCVASSASSEYIIRNLSFLTSKWILKKKMFIKRISVVIKQWLLSFSPVKLQYAIFTRTRKFFITSFGTVSLVNNRYVICCMYNIGKEIAESC